MLEGKQILGCELDRAVRVVAFIIELSYGWKRKQDVFGQEQIYWNKIVVCEVRGMCLELLEVVVI